MLRNQRNLPSIPGNIYLWENSSLTDFTPSESQIGMSLTDNNPQTGPDEDEALEETSTWPFPAENHLSSTSKIEGNSSLPIDMVFNDGHIILISCYSGIFVVSLIGNLCVLWAILAGNKRTRKSSRVNLMLLHLAVADLIVTTIMIPVEVGWAATVQWTAGDALCRIFSFFRIFGHYLSSFILVCISIDRYFAVVHPLSLNAADRRGKIMLGFAWLLAFSCSLPQVVIFHVDFHPIHEFYQQCVTFGFFPSIYHEMVYNLFCLAVLYLVPLAVIVISYGVIIATIFQKSRLTSDDNCIRRSGVGYLGRAKVTTIKMTVSIVLAFFVCWTPYVIISLWFCFDRSAAALIDIKIQKALFIFACTNSCANPIVYGIFNFCRKSPTRTQTWKSATHTSRMMSKRICCSCSPKQRDKSCPLHRYPTLEITENASEVSDIPKELLPSILNASNQTRDQDASNMECIEELQEIWNGNERERNERLALHEENGSFHTSSRSFMGPMKGSVL